MVNYWAATDVSVALLTLTNRVADHYALDPRVARRRIELIWDSRNRWEGLVATLRRCRAIRRVVQDYRPDIVISFIDRTNVLVLASLVGTGIPVIVSERVDPRMTTMDPGWALARRVLYPLCAALVVQTKSVVEWAQQLVASRKIGCIPNAIGRHPEPSPTSQRRSVVLGVGRLVPQKGFDILIRSFAETAACRQGWRLQILGEGPERRCLEALIRQYGLEGKVDLPGVVRDPSAWFDQAKMFVLSSRFEGFPNVLIEAMAMGCASIATDCPSGPGEIVADRRNGLLVPVEDVEALASAIDELAASEDLVFRLSREGQSVREQFNVDRVMAEWNELIQTVLEEASE